ncbi:MAG: hypothetical protein PHN82_06040 [bacterium]|nr:hypothetical protein [bacterium]
MRVVTVAPVLAAAFLCAAWASPDLPLPPPGRFELEYTEGRVSVRANEASVEEILRDLSAKSGITFNQYTGKSARVTLEMTDAGVEQLLDRLLASYATRSRRVDGVVRISAVTVMESGVPAPLPPEPPPEQPPEPTPQEEPAEEQPQEEQPQEEAPHPPEHEPRVGEEGHGGAARRGMPPRVPRRRRGRPIRENVPQEP